MDLIRTIEDDGQPSVPESDDSNQQEVACEATKRRKKRKQPSKASAEFVEGFSFQTDSTADDWASWDLGEAMGAVSKPVSMATSLSAKIARALQQKKSLQKKIADEKLDISMSEADQRTDSLPTSSEEGSDIDEDSVKDINEDTLPDSEAYFDQTLPTVQLADISFTDMNLSRPLLKAVNSLGFVSPTPIQAKTIPIALLGKDICASAATGTGKTAAYILPVLERLLYRPTRSSTSRVLVLVPTRELAIQVHSVSKTLARHTRIEICLAAGGLDSKGQVAALRKSPDVIVATPGRLLDHLHNAPSFTLDSLEILILDEADRMLDEHFLDQMNELIRLCPRGRQTMLFSATMTDEVKELMRLSLNQPVKLFVDSNTDTAYNLRQEFVRIRTKHEGDREAIVAALCVRTFHVQCLLFLNTKKDCHRLCIILSLLGLKATELHGNLTMLQRLESLRQFKDGEVDYLVATDLAARGLDIAGVITVINLNMPANLKQYIHRVGRTARAGNSGRSVTLVGEKERKILKEIVKQARLPVKSRVLSHDIVHKYKEKVSSYEGEIKGILKEEHEEKELRVTEMEMNKARNMIEHRDEILSRPPRVWFQSESKKATSSKEANKQIKKREKPGERDPNMEFAVREAKRSRKQKRLRVISDDTPEPKKRKVVRKSYVINTFEQELTDTSKRSLNQLKNDKAFKSNKASKQKGKFKSKKRFKRK